jgi:hypothetical protein
MNAGKIDEQPQENTVPHWLLHVFAIKRNIRENVTWHVKMSQVTF